MSGLVVGAAWHRHHNGVVCREDKCRMLPSVTAFFGVVSITPPTCGNPYPHSHPHDCKAALDAPSEVPHD